MNEHYLEWLFLREHLDYWINTRFQLDGKEQFFFNGKEYNVEAMKARYIELTKMLLKDYEEESTTFRVTNIQNSSVTENGKYNPSKDASI